MVPASSVPNCNPRMVMMGISALRKACRNRTAAVDNPLARAVRIALRNYRAHWCAKFQRFAQITMGKLPQITKILLTNGLIQGKRMAQFADLARSGAFAKHLFHRVAGNDMDQQKNQGEYQPK